MSIITLKLFFPLNLPRRRNEFIEHTVSLRDTVCSIYNKKRSMIYINHGSLKSKNWFVPNIDLFILPELLPLQGTLLQLHQLDMFQDPQHHFPIALLLQWRLLEKTDHEGSPFLQELICR